MRRLETSGQFVAAWSAVAMLLCLPVCFLTSEVPNDTAAYYTPMIRAFAAADWQAAYYPPIPPLLPTLGGIVAMISGVEPFTAAKLVSSAFFVACVAPYYWLNRMIWDERVARWSVILFVLCSRLLSLSTCGILDSGKMLGVVTLACGVWWYGKGGRWRALALVTFASIVLAVIRGEGPMVAAMGIAWLMVTEWRQGRGWRRLPWRSVAVIGLTVAVISPWLMYERRQTGYWVTDSRQIGVVRSLLGVVGVETAAPPATVRYTNDPDVSNPDREGTSLLRHLYTSVLVQFVNGLIPPYLPFLIIGLFVFSRRRLWSSGHVFLISAFVLHTLMLLVVLGDWVDRRYIMATAPLLFGWVAWTLIQIWDLLRMSLAPPSARHTGIVVTSLFVVASVSHSFSSLYPERKPDKREQAAITADVVERLRQTSPEWASKAPLTYASQMGEYHNGRPVLIVSSRPQIAMAANTDLMQPRFPWRFLEPDRAWVAFQGMCADRRPHAIIADRVLARTLGMSDLSGRELPGYVAWYTAEPEYPRNFVTVYVREDLVSSAAASSSE